MGKRTRDAEAELNLPPGFRFHPTDEELVAHYLCRKAAQQPLPVSIIAEIDLYKYDPWQLPKMALFGSREWYFFTPRDRKYPNGSRPNRAAGGGYWKATGADKPITPAGSVRPLGIKKALVFYAGKAPKGIKTDWIMHEYRLVGAKSTSNKKEAGGGNLRLDDWVLCRLYNKKNNWQKGTYTHTMEASVGDTMDSREATDDTASGSMRTPESDVDDDLYAEHGGSQRPLLYAPPQVFTASPAPGTDYAAAGPQLADRVKEEEDWFMDLNLDDFQSSLLALGEAPSVDFPGQDYCLFGLTSSQMRPAYLPNLPTF